MRKFPLGSDMFEASFLGSMYMSTILQSFANPGVTLCTSEYRKCEVFFAHFGRVNHKVQQHVVLVQISELKQQAKRAIDTNSSLEPIIGKARILHSEMQNILSGLRDELRVVEELGKDVLSSTVHAGHQRLLGVAIASFVLLLCVQQALSPGNTTLKSVAAGACEEVLELCNNARIYRPSGAVWTVHSLICVWCGAQDAHLRQRVYDALFDYQRDAMGPRAVVHTHQLKALERRLYMLD